MIDRIQWLGHGSFVITGSPTIYINPWRISRDAPQADIILISHDHYEHCSLADVNKLRDDHTTIITNERAASIIPGSTILRPWQSMTHGRTSVQSVPAYSPNSFEHPREDGGLGFIISMKYYDIYYAGDTELIPEMQRVHPDIAILPIDGRGTMDAAQAAQAAEIMRPRWVIPSNWNKQLGGTLPLDVLQFQNMVSTNAEVVIPFTRRYAA